MTEATDTQTTTGQPQGLATTPCSPLNWRADFDEHDNTTWEANGPYTDEDGSCEFLFKITQRLREDKHEFVEDSDAELMMDDEDPRVWLSLEAAQRAMAQDYADIVRDCAAFGERPGSGDGERKAMSSKQNVNEPFCETLKEAERRILELEHALEKVKEGLAGAANSNIADYIDAVLSPNAKLTHEAGAKDL